MLEISLDQSNLQHGLDRLLKNATDTHPMMRALATEMVSITEDNFERESWGGEKWKQSRRAAQGGKTLQLSGQLAASIDTKIGNNFARIGSSKKYAAVHHLGGQAGRGKKTTLPARPYLPINGDGQLQNGAEQKLLQTALDALSAGV